MRGSLLFIFLCFSVPAAAAISLAGLDSIVKEDLTQVGVQNGLIDVRRVLRSHDTLLLVFPFVPRLTELDTSNPSYFRRVELFFLGQTTYGSAWHLPQGVWFEIPVNETQKRKLSQWARDGFFPDLPRTPCTLLVEEILRRLGLFSLHRFTVAPHLFLEDVAANGLNRTRLRAHLWGVDSVEDLYQGTRERDQMVFDETLQEARLEPGLFNKLFFSGLSVQAQVKLLPFFTPCSYRLREVLHRRKN